MTASSRREKGRLSGPPRDPANVRVVGLTGPNASGKGEAAACLGRLGFTVHSLSDIVREEASARGLGHGREDLIRVGNDLRAREGSGALAERILPRLAGRGRHVVDSIRNPGEVAVLRRVEGFVLVGVAAPIAERFARSRARGRVGDGLTLDEFRVREEKENTADPAAQQLTATLALADHVIENTGSLDDLRDRLVEIVSAQS